jgi:ABC-type uncharacterized transport system substrate-binding protein
MQKLITIYFKSLLKKIVLTLVFMFSMMMGTFSSAVLAQTNNPTLSLAPVTHQGAPWRIAYIEARPFANYAATLANMVIALHKMGWIKSIEGLPYVKGQVDAQIIWAWMAQKKDEPYLQFLENGFYTFDKLKVDKVDARAQQIAQRLSQANGVDLVLAMGTVAAEKILPYEITIPIVSMSTSNAMEAGIVKGAEFSGVDQVWAHMDPYRYKRQMDIFYDIFKFKKLGVVYDDDTAGRSFAAIDDVLNVAKSRQFEVVFENIQQPPKYSANKKQFAEDLRAAFTRLAPQVDAVYLGLFIGNDPTQLAYELEPLVSRKIPVFAQQSNDVSSGALMSLARQNFSGVGAFNARAMVRILKGESPSKISQIYENSPNIIINLDIAKEIGFRPRFELLLGADQTIKAAK